MREIAIVLRNESGLHARPAAQFVRLANSFESSIKLTYKGRTVNAKSMIEVMTAAAPKGSEIVIRADGPDEAEALAALENLLLRELVE